MAQEILNVSQLKVGVEDKEILHGVDPVSYTHLTLPTT